MKTKLTIYKDEKNDWRWSVTSSNGKIIAASTEGYKRKRSVIANLKSISESLEYHDYVFEK